MAETDLQEFEPLEQARESAPATDSSSFDASKGGSENEGGFDPTSFDFATRRSQWRHTPRVSTQEEAEKIPPGMAFIGPDGERRVVPYKVMQPSDLNDVPDGADFVGPDGELRTKPQYQGIDFTAQYLYNVAHTDRGRRKALERSYPGKVRDDPAGGFFVEDEDGVLRKPGRGAAASGGGIASAAAPTVLGIGGAIGGSVFGGAPGVAGAFAGGAAGSKANDIVSSLAGVYDDENSWRDAAIEGGLSAGGQVVGRYAGPVIKRAGEAISSGKRVIPSFVNNMLGTDEAALRAAIPLAEKGSEPGKLGLRKAGTEVPPSQIFKESPAIQNIVEFKEPALRTQDPLKMSREAHYERSVGEILEGLGVGKPMSRTEIDRTFKELVTAQEAGNIPLVEKLEDVLSKVNVRSATHPDAAVSVEAAGNRILESVRAKSAASDQRLKELLELRKADVERRGAISEQSHAARTAELRAAQENAQRDAQALIDQGFADLDRQSKDALHVARSGHNSGDLWRSVGSQIAEYRTGIQARARIMYDTADELSGATLNRSTGMWEGGARVNAEGLAPRAQAFLDQLPEEFERNHPVIVQRIRALGNADEPPTWAQLHDLRTMLRQNIKWNDLSSDVANGTYKYFNNRVNEVLRSGEGTLVPQAASPAVADLDRVRQAALNVRPDGGSVMFKDLKAALGVDDNELVTILDRIDRSPDARTSGGQAINFLGSTTTKDARNARVSIGGRDFTGIAFRDAPPPAVQSARGQLREAVAALDRADQFYRTNMGPLGTKEIQNVMNALDSGLQADPKALLNLIMKEGKTEVAQQIERIVGANTWNALRAADVQEILQTSNYFGQINSKKFAQEVLKRDNQGLLTTLHGPQAARLVEQARQIEQLAGRLQIAAQPGDTASDIIMRARAAATAAQEAGKKDPLNTLKQEMAGIKKEHAAARKAALEKNEFAFALDPTVGAHAAIDRILSHPDMLVAASRAFAGAEASPEFELIRQVYAQRFLQRSRTNLRPAKQLAEMTPEIQSLMFPGVSLKQMQLFAKEMELLVPKGSDGGKGIMKTNIQENPLGAASGLGKLAGPAKMIPGANMGARKVLGDYYALVRHIATSPTTLRWLEKGLTSSDPVGREEARAVLRAIAQKSGIVGAGVGAAAGTFATGADDNE